MAGNGGGAGAGPFSGCTPANPSRRRARKGSSRKSRRKGGGKGWGFGLWGCHPDPKRALGAHGVPLTGEVRLRHTLLTPNHAVWERGIHLLVRSGKGVGVGVGTKYLMAGS